jgi:aspartyl protease family protein
VSSGGDDALSFVYLMLILVLVGSGLMVRRLPWAQTVEMALAWLLIFAAAFVAFTLKDDFKALGRRIMNESTSVAQGQGGELRIKKSEDGHFWVDAQLNGTSVRFLIDSGATVTAISPRTAERAGIEPVGNYPVILDTANGRVEAKRGRAERLVVGTIERRDLGVHIASGLGDTNLLGMNFLSTLSAWRVEGQWLVLTP